MSDRTAGSNTDETQHTAPSYEFKGISILAESNRIGDRWQALNPRAEFQFITFSLVATVTYTYETHVGYLAAASIHRAKTCSPSQHPPLSRDRLSQFESLFAGGYPPLHAAQSEPCGPPADRRLNLLHVAYTLSVNRYRLPASVVDHALPPRWKAGGSFEPLLVVEFPYHSEMKRMSRGPR